MCVATRGTLLGLSPASWTEEHRVCWVGGGSYFIESHAPAALREAACYMEKATEARHRQEAQIASPTQEQPQTNPSQTASNQQQRQTR